MRVPQISFLCTDMFVQSNIKDPGLLLCSFQNYRFELTSDLFKCLADMLKLICESVLLTRIIAFLTFIQTKSSKPLTYMSEFGSLMPLCC